MPLQFAVLAKLRIHGYLLEIWNAEQKFMMKRENSG